MLVTRGLGKKQSQTGALLTTSGLGRTGDLGGEPVEERKPWLRVVHRFRRKVK